MKRCPKCGVTKPLEDFARQASRTDGRQSHCRACKAEAFKAYYKGPAKEAWASRRRARVDVLMGHIFEHLKTNACVDCGESDIVVLEFDHVRGTKGGNVTEMALHASVSLERLKEEIAKCDVRCANDHRRRTYQDSRRSRSA